MRKQQKNWDNARRNIRQNGGKKYVKKEGKDNRRKERVCIKEKKQRK
jgi:hypothetical protein